MKLQLGKNNPESVLTDTPEQNYQLIISNPNQKLYHRQWEK